MSHFSQMTDAQLKNMLLRLNNCADASHIAQAPIKMKLKTFFRMFLKTLDISMQ